MKYLLYPFPLIFLLGSCGPSVLYQKSIEIPGENWLYADTLDYHFTVEDTTQIYNLYLTLWHNRDFPFQNAYVMVYTAFPDGQRISERLSLQMMDPETSTWLGDCGKESCRLELALQEGAFFEQAGEYSITLEQHSRRNPLPGVEKVELKIEETGKTKFE